ncbi:M1 family metallopeptidase [Solirubrobacter ginsenosidimutans]|uniref:Aminopeptidase N n=1 Tax=Solirubrobacter ginsenosidimutans TaxID=490573 RepID=A0A9X3S6K3_9ACTN|nr:M1 family metallopeptidase [Solirubrobacter ginsenosidimutans]MDA0165211.1 M1 family metallopeptidase [Solirubrobacter ginsenosidimutans]
MRRLPFAAAALVALMAPASAYAAEQPSPGAAGIGDRLFPKLGNGGYDVQHYDIALNYATAAPSQGIDGTVTITAKATQSLSRFDLDFAGDSVGSIAVNDQPATFSRADQDLVITPAQPLPKGKPFVVTVSDYKAHPKRPSGDNILNNAFIVTPDGSATLPQPSGAHVFLPSNDHPRDKATFTFRLDVPDGETAVANGDLESQTSAGGRTTFVYQQQQPMATELIQLAVGSYKLIDRGVQDGVHVRDVVAPSLEPLLADKLPVEIDQLAWLKARVGAYPFSSYGSFVVDAAIGASLETQSLSIFDREVFQGSLGTWPTTMLHETAHQWFGDSVSPHEWSDVWLNEGHATYYQWSYAAEHGEIKADAGVSDTFAGTLKSYYELGDFYRQKIEPVARPKSSAFKQLFSAQQYFGGAVALYALRQKVGETTFRKIERAWVTRYAGKSASTADYIALASKVSGKHLGPFLHDWLYGTKTPAMPGHPDWKVKSVKEVEGGPPTH